MDTAGEWSGAAAVQEPAVQVCEADGVRAGYAVCPARTQFCVCCLWTLLWDLQAARETRAVGWVCTLKGTWQVHKQRQGVNPADACRLLEAL